MRTERGKDIRNTKYYRVVAGVVSAQNCASAACGPPYPPPAWPINQWRSDFLSLHIFGVPFSVSFPRSLQRTVRTYLALKSGP